MYVYSLEKLKIIRLFEFRKVLLFFFSLGVLLILMRHGPVVAKNVNSDQRYIKDLSSSKQNAKLVNNENVTKQSNGLSVSMHGCDISAIQKIQFKYNEPIVDDWRVQRNRLNKNPLKSVSSTKKIKQLAFSVDRITPHDENAFTQGLAYYKGALYESTGGLGDSQLRKLNVSTGEVIQVKKLPDYYFAEGLTRINAQLVQLTLKKNVAQVYDINSFDLIDQFGFKGDGWGLVALNGDLVISDGSSVLKKISANDFSLIEEINVTANGIALTGINEMEVVEGWLFANILPTNCVAVIDTVKFTVIGWLNLAALYPEKQRANVFSVLNGLAYDDVEKTLLVTGKYWPKIYHLKLNDLTNGPE